MSGRATTRSICSTTARPRPCRSNARRANRICYGAWIQGDQNTYWGVGPDNSQKCENCCYTCTGGETEQINLVP